jgi:hypothetical protein
MENPLLTFHGGKKNNENFPSVGNCADGMLEKSRKGFSENAFFLIKNKKKHFTAHSGALQKLENHRFKNFLSSSPQVFPSKNVILYLKGQCHEMLTQSTHSTKYTLHKVHNSWYWYTLHNIRYTLHNIRTVHITQSTHSTIYNSTIYR